jgi:hypothetical protein
MVAVIFHESHFWVTFFSGIYPLTKNVRAISRAQSETAFNSASTTVELMPRTYLVRVSRDCYSSSVTLFGHFHVIVRDFLSSQVCPGNCWSWIWISVQFCGENRWVDARDILGSYGWWRSLFTNITFLSIFRYVAAIFSLLRHVRAIRETES